MAGLGAALALQWNVQTETFSPTFTYAGPTMPALNSPVCAGDVLEMAVTVHNSGRAAPTLLTGSIRRPESSVPVDRTIPPVWAAGQATGVEATVTFTYAASIPTTLPPGEYVYTHSAQQLHSFPQGYESNFIVEECFDD